MREAVIVSTARTPTGKAFRGAFNQTHGATMAGHAIEHAVSRAGIDPGEVEDVILGCGLPEGATGKNIARLSAVRPAICWNGLTMDRSRRRGRPRQNARDRRGSAELSSQPVPAPACDRVEPPVTRTIERTHLDNPHATLPTEQEHLATPCRAMSNIARRRTRHSQERQSADRRFRAKKCRSRTG